MYVSGHEIGGQLCKEWDLEGVRDIVIRLPLDGVASIEMDCLLGLAQAPFVTQTLRTYALVPREPWTAVETGLPLGVADSQLYWTWDGVNVELHHWYRHTWTKVAGGQPLRPILAWQICQAPTPPPEIQS